MVSMLRRSLCFGVSDVSPSELNISFHANFRYCDCFHRVDFRNRIDSSALPMSFRPYLKPTVHCPWRAYLLARATFITRFSMHSDKLFALYHILILEASCNSKIKDRHDEQSLTNATRNLDLTIFLALNVHSMCSSNLRSLT
jgi:hypothetical protein